MLINEQFALKFINRIAGKMPYNVNIINEKGVIIATSKDSHRIGEFHDIAYNMIQQNTKENITTISQAALSGSHAGVNFLIRSNGKNAGVCGVTGDPDEVYDIALVIRMAFESMLEYESQYAIMETRRNTKLRFVNTLLYHEGYSPAADLAMMAYQLGYTSTICRIPILITFSRELKDSDEILKTLQSSPESNNQDISVCLNNFQLLIFKSFTTTDEQKLFYKYKPMIEQYLLPFIQRADENTISYKIYVGTFQLNLQDYAFAFQHCNWLSNHVRHKAENDCYFFYDYLQDYFERLIPYAELNKVFHVIAGGLSKDMRENILSIIPSLERNNYNLNTCSQELFIHKNTLVFRLNKIRDCFGLNPVKSTTDRNFLFYLNNLLEKQQSTHQNSSTVPPLS